VQIKLKNFSTSIFEEIISNKEKRCILYCDFNVANFLYEQNLTVPENFILYPDSTLIQFLLST